MPIQWPRGIRRGYAVVRLVRLWVRITVGEWMFVSWEWCVSGASGWSLVQRSPTESVVYCQVRRADHFSRGALLRVVCVVRCVGLITCPEEPYWEWCVLSGALGWSLVQRSPTESVVYCQVRWADHVFRGALLRVVCVVRCVGLITRPEESYWECRVLSGASGWSRVQRSPTESGVWCQVRRADHSSRGILLSVVTNPRQWGLGPLGSLAPY